jgi:multimeric flavodoxin WrbA
MKYFIDQLVGEWLSGSMIGKPAGVFTSTGTSDAFGISKVELAWDAVA